MTQKNLKVKPVMALLLGDLNKMICISKTNFKEQLQNQDLLLQKQLHGLQLADKSIPY
jgi:hypothetical protein